MTYEPDLIDVTPPADTLPAAMARLNANLEEIAAALAALASGIPVTIDAGASAIETGTHGLFWIAPFSGSITGWTIVTDPELAGSIVVDIWKSDYANYPPTVADTITGATPPTLDAAIKAQSVSVADWSPDFNAGDIFLFNVVSATTVKRVILSIQMTLTV